MAGGITPIEVPGVPTLGTNQVSIGNTATLILPVRTGRRSLIIVQHGTVDVFIGDSGVTTSNGLLLTGTKGASLSIPGTMAVYAIVASGTQTVSYLEIY